MSARRSALTLAGLNNMRALSIFLFTTVSLGAAEPTFTATGVKTPVFDADGRLNYRLTAASAFGPFDSPQLEKGQVEFFSLESQKESVAVLSFEQAKYQKSAETISGNGTIKLVSRDGTISGHGYTCRVVVGLLTLGSQVKFDSRDFRMTGDEAEVHFDPKISQRDEIIREAVVKGHILVEGTADSKMPYDRVESTFARYSAADQKIYLKTPVTVWQHGVSSVTNLASEFFEINLPEKPNQAPGPTSTSVTSRAIESKGEKSKSN